MTLFGSGGCWEDVGDDVRGGVVRVRGYLV